MVVSKKIFLFILFSILTIFSIVDVHANESTVRVPMTVDEYDINLLHVGSTADDLMWVQLDMSVTSGTTSLVYTFDADDTVVSDLTVWDVTPYAGTSFEPVTTFYDHFNNILGTFPTYTVVGTNVGGTHVIDLTSRYSYEYDGQLISIVGRVVVRYLATVGYTVNNPSPGIFPPRDSGWFSRLGASLTFERDVFIGRVPETSWLYYGGASGYIERRFYIYDDTDTVSLYFPRGYIYGGFLLESSTSEPSTIAFLDNESDLIDIIEIRDISDFINGYWLDFDVPDGAVQVVVKVWVPVAISSMVLEDLNQVILFEINRHLITYIFVDGNSIVKTLRTSNRLIANEVPDPVEKPGLVFSRFVYATYETVDFNSPIKLDTLTSDNEVYIYLIYDDISITDVVDTNPNFLVELFASIGISNKFGYLMLLLFVTFAVLLICAITGINIVLGGMLSLSLGGVMYWLGLIGFVEVLILIIIFALTFLFRRAQDE